MAIANIKAAFLCPVEKIWDVVTDKELYKIWAFNLENENIKGHWSDKFYRQEDKTTLDFTEMLQ